MEESIQMETNKVTEVLAGALLGKGVQTAIRYYVDLPVAQMSLYPPTQYAVDLKKAGYVVQAADSTKSDDEIGTTILSDTGYTYASGPGNLMGTARLTANKYTYRAAAGQKVPAYLFPSFWLSGALGGAAVLEGAKNFSKMAFTKKNELGVTTMGATMLMDSLARATGLEGTVSAPSGFDVSKQPAFQQLDQSAVANLRRLSDENGRLQTELAQLRSMNRPAQTQPAQTQPVQTAAYRYNAPQPQVTVTGTPQVTITPVCTDIIPSRGAEYVKDRMHMMGIHRATGETVRNNTGLVTLSGGK
jgi:hypothetical protein